MKKIDCTKVLAEALQLPCLERAMLIEKLVASFNFPEREAIDAAWAQEAEERIAAYQNGELESLSATKVFEKINQQRT